MGEAVTLVIGIGCRKGCPAEDILALVMASLAGLPRAQAQLFTIEARQDEPGLVEAALHLGWPLVGLPEAALRERLADVTILSSQAERAVGVPSVAEAAALAGAGPGSRLLVPRRSAGGATCAVAVGPAQP